MKTMVRSLVVVIALVTSASVRAANIVWVSDANDPLTGAATFSGFFPAGSGYTDSAFVTMLESAGHNVIRFNQPNAQGTLLTPEQIAALNTNDLIIIGRCVNSAAFQQGQGDQWNVDITAPLIDQSPFHVRSGSNRLGWFAGAEGPDDTPTVLSARLLGDPAIDAAIDYLFAGVPMNGTNTWFAYDELLDRNTSHIGGAPAAGGIIYASATYTNENSTAVPPAMSTGNAIVGFPAGTAVRFGTNILGGYRMFFAAGSREGSTAPNAIPLYAGRETLTPTGEDVFLRAVNLAINSGTAPAADPLAPIGFTSQPGSVTVLQNLTAAFSVSVTGAAPRTVQWQRDIGDGITFTNIPDASTPFSASQLIITNVTLADDGARFRVEASNPNGTTHSSVAVLTVTPDSTPPVPVSAVSLDGLTIAVCFNELLDNRLVENSAEDPFNYFINSAALPTMAKLQPDGRSVVLTLENPISANFVLTIQNVQDRLGNPIDPGIDLQGTYLPLTTVSVGAQNPAGSVFACAANAFQVMGGGLDLQNTADQLQFLYRAVTGDFDARVRVSSLRGIDRFESVAKAILTARATADANAATINAFVTPRAPADQSVASTYRATAGGSTTTNVPPSVYSAGPEGVWLRITRSGDTFTTYYSADNAATWTQLDAASLPNLGPSPLVGIGVNSHRNGRLAVGMFHDFQVIQAPAAPVLINPNYTGTAFAASFQSQPGATYHVQYNDDLNTSDWMPLTTITGDGAVQTFSDPGPLPQKRFYRIRTQ